jgi:carbonic anhydrase
MGKHSTYDTWAQPRRYQSKFDGYDFAIPTKTLMIHCLDPRAADIPQAVAAYLGDEDHSGEIILDETGNRVGSTRKLLTATDTGGRAAPALMSVTETEPLFDVENVVVVHHSFRDTTSDTPEIVFEQPFEYHRTDISHLLDRDSLARTDHEKSLRYDIELLRNSPAVPKHVNLYGFFYEIQSGRLTEVIRDIPE